MEWINYVGIVLALFVSIVVLSQSSKTATSKILVVWMACLALPILTKLTHTFYPGFRIPFLFDVRAFPLMFGPCLLFYTSSLIYQDFTLKRLDLLHVLPFVLFAVLQMVYPEQFMFPGKKSPESSPQPILESAHGITILISLIGYSTAVLLILNQHRKKVYNHFSEITYRVTLKWLYLLVGGFIVAYSIPLFFDVIFPFLSISVVVSTKGLHGQMFTFFIFVLGIFGLRQSPVYQPHQVAEASEKRMPHDTIPNRQKVEFEKQPHVKDEASQISEAKKKAQSSKAIEKSSPKYEKSGLKEDQIEAFLMRIESFMKNNKPYLDGSLTIESLSKDLSIQKHYITQILNKRLSKNFYQFVNEYRVNEAIKSLKSDKKQKLNLMQIALDSGFNSKSTFNKFFKLHTTMTPTEYRKSILSKVHP